MDRSRAFRSPVPVTELAAAALVIVGCLLRVAQFKSGGFPWPGELMLYRMSALGWSELLFNPLDFSQFKAPGFLAATKIAQNLFASPDVGMRIVPLLSSLLGVLLAWLIARRLVSGGWLVLLVGLFALNPIFIFYAAAPASFPVDLLVALAVLLAVLRMREADFRPASIAVTAVVGASGLFLSQYAIVSLVGMWVALGMMAQERRDRRTVRAWVALGAVWLIIALGATALDSPNTELETVEGRRFATAAEVPGV